MKKLTPNTLWAISGGGGSILLYEFRDNRVDVPIA